MSDHNLIMIIRRRRKIMIIVVVVVIMISMKDKTGQEAVSKVGPVPPRGFA